MNQTVEKIAVLIEDAIAENLALQSAYVKKLEEISKIKVDNRLECIKLKNALHEYSTRHCTQDDCYWSGYSKKSSTNNVVDRKWKRRFFIDAKNTIPEANPDTVLRRKWEGELASANYLYRFTPWSKEELSLLVEIAEEVRKEQQQQHDNDDDETDHIASTIVKDSDIDFQEVAKRMNAKLSEKKLSNPQKLYLQSHTYSLSNGMLQGGYTPRSWVDYRIKFLNCLSPYINKRPFTKAESLKVIEFLHEHNGNPPWHLVAQALNTSRTPFQCFHHAQTKLSHTLSNDISSSSIFTPDEDELLFKFIAASGPQTVINHHTATLMAQKLFPNVSHFQIINRANMSLVNPQYVNEKWTEEEERTLAMAMKVYSKTDNALAKASFLLDGRSAKMVADKWIRSMNPCYNTQSFSKEEDKALVATVKQLNANPENWTKVASKFPYRNPRALLNRWIELANVQDVAKMQGNQLVQRRVRRLGRKTLNKSKSVANKVETNDVITSDDFALRVKKRQRVVHEKT
mmetsp:Transcript_8137/g.15317  ORF Transcript_8137/g.15317 Transcript_8137/m.15317 type:complete len:515 (+) Transcript_8137:32-1576(+)